MFSSVLVGLFVTIAGLRKNYSTDFAQNSVR